MSEEELRARIDGALAFASEWLSDGDHHKMWLIDQMVRELTGEDYSAWVARYEEGEDGPHTYSWDEGIAP